MNLYIYSYLPRVTSNWHNGGGAAVIAPTIEDAKAILIEECGQFGLTAESFNDSGLPQIFPLAGEEQAKVVEIFPDAGCC